MTKKKTLKELCSTKDGINKVAASLMPKLYKTWKEVIGLSICELCEHNKKRKACAKWVSMIEKSFFPSAIQGRLPSQVNPKCDYFVEDMTKKIMNKEW